MTHKNLLPLHHPATQEAAFKMALVLDQYDMQPLVQTLSAWLAERVHMLDMSFPQSPAYVLRQVVSFQFHLF